MGTKGEQLAARFEEANDKLVQAVEETSDADWPALGPEGWTLAATAHHVGNVVPNLLQLIGAVATGQQVPPVKRTDFDVANAQHAKECAAVGKLETLDLLRSSGTTASQALRAMSDEELGASSPVAVGMPDMTAQQVVENVLIGHALGHLESIQTARANARERRITAVRRSAALAKESGASSNTPAGAAAEMNCEL